MAAVKMCVALLPPLIAIPVFLMCRGLCARAGHPESRVPFLAAVTASLGSPFMIMTGHLDKNALAMVWFSALIAALHAFMQRQTARSFTIVTLFVGILGLSHVATFGAGMLILGCVLSVYLLLPSAIPLRRMAPFAAVLVVVIAVTQAIVFWKFDPARIGRLLGAATNPLHFVTSDDLVTQGTLLTPDAPHIVIAIVKTLLLAGVGAMVVRAVRPHRSEMSAADFALIAGCAIGVTFLTGPWVSNDSAPRLALIACVPALIVGAFMLVHTQSERIRRATVTCCVLFVIAPGVLQCARGGWRVLSDEAYAELKTAASRIPAPDKTLVVSMHGTEWDAAWVLRTDVAHLSVLHARDWQRYEQVLYLTATGRVQPISVFGRMIGVGGVGTDKKGRRVLEVGPFARIPFIDIPKGAEPVLEGEHITLARVATPPPDVRTD